MKKKMKKLEAIKTYFAQGMDAREVTTAELMILRKSGPDNYNEVAELCAKELDVELEA